MTASLFPLIALGPVPEAQPIQLPAIVNPHAIAYVDEVIATPTPSVALVVSGQLKQAIDGLYARMGNLPVLADQLTYDAMRELVRDAATMRKHVEASRKVAKQPFLDIGAKIDETARPYLEQLDVLIAEGKNQERAFLADRDRQIREAQEKQRLAEIEAAKDTSRPTAPLQPIALPPVINAALARRPTVVIIDVALIPREYLVPDMVRINADALAGKAIAGVAVQYVTDVVAR